MRTKREELIRDGKVESETSSRDSGITVGTSTSTSLELNLSVSLNLEVDSVLTESGR